MAFQFGLASLLRLRQAVERSREVELAKAQQRVVALQAKLSTIQHTLVEWHENRCRRLCKTTHAADLHFFNACECETRNFLMRVQHELQKATEERNQQLSKYIGARRDREAFEILREEQWRRYSEQDRRRQQQASDDLFLSRLRSYNRD